VRPLIYREAPAVISPEVKRLPDVPLILPTPKPPVKYVLPEMARDCEGEDVPIPTLPPPTPRRTPPPNVEVAVVPVALKYGAAIFVPDSIPPEKVVVPVVVKTFNPEKRFESARRVDDAKVQVVVAYEYRTPEELTASPPVERPVKATVPVAVRVPMVERPSVDEPM
jgi:hypothetical protein